MISEVYKFTKLFARVHSQFRAYKRLYNILSLRDTRTHKNIHPKTQIHESQSSASLGVHGQIDVAWLVLRTRGAKMHERTLTRADARSRVRSQCWRNYGSRWFNQSSCKNNHRLLGRWSQKTPNRMKVCRWKQLHSRETLPRQVICF